MSNTLRDRVAKLAHENPELRKHLLPLLKKYADSGLTGKTFEGPYLRFHAYSHSYQVEELVNAGKRGKVVDGFTLYDTDMIRDEEIQTAVAQFGFRLKNMKYDAALAMAQELANRAAEQGWSYPKLHLTTKRGVDVMPAGVKTIRIQTPFVDIEADMNRLASGTVRIRTTCLRASLPQRARRRSCLCFIAGSKRTKTRFVVWPTMKFWNCCGVRASSTTATAPWTRLTSQTFSVDRTCGSVSCHRTLDESAFP